MDRVSQPLLGGAMHSTSTGYPRGIWNAYLVYTMPFGVVPTQWKFQCWMPPKQVWYQLSDLGYIESSVGLGGTPPPMESIPGAFFLFSLASLTQMLSLGRLPSSSRFLALVRWNTDFRHACMEAIMAGAPNPCVHRLKCWRSAWIVSGLTTSPSDDMLSTSTNSCRICLKRVYIYFWRYLLEREESINSINSIALTQHSTSTLYVSACSRCWYDADRWHEPLDWQPGTRSRWWRRNREPDAWLHLNSIVIADWSRTRQTLVEIHLHTPLIDTFDKRCK